MDSKFADAVIGFVTTMVLLGGLINSCTKTGKKEREEAVSGGTKETRRSLSSLSEEAQKAVSNFKAKKRQLQRARAKEKEAKAQLQRLQKQFRQEAQETKEKGTAQESQSEKEVLEQVFGFLREAWKWLGKLQEKQKEQKEAQKEAKKEITQKVKRAPSTQTPLPSQPNRFSLPPPPLPPRPSPSPPSYFSPPASGQVGYRNSYGGRDLSIYDSSAAQLGRVKVEFRGMDRHGSARYRRRFSVPQERITAFKRSMEKIERELQISDFWRRSVTEPDKIKKEERLYGESELPLGRQRLQVIVYGYSFNGRRKKVLRGFSVAFKDIPKFKMAVEALQKEFGVAYPGQSIEEALRGR